MRPPSLFLRPRHKWFAAPFTDDDMWYGPRDTIEDAVSHCIDITGSGEVFSVAHGYRLKKAEKEEFGAEYEWEVDAANAIEVHLPVKKKGGR